ncbi:MAG: TolC family protein [Verrucomicrobiales bacterium]|nr:TolC family protein [Verrucomicrobiales bacterium]
MERLHTKHAGLRVATLFAAAGMVCLSGCHHTAYKKRADRETNRILQKKVRDVANVNWNSVDITLPDPATLEGLGLNPEQAEYLGKIAEEEADAVQLTLADALNFAIHYNRDYLSQKESIFLQALELTLARHNFAPIFEGEGDLTRASDTRTGDRTVVIPAEDTAAAAIVDTARADLATAEATLADAELLEDPGAAAAARAEIAVARDIIDDADRSALATELNFLIAEHTLTRNQRVGVSKLTRTGARIAADFTGDFLKFMLGDRQINNSQLAVSLIQPIMRGGGTAVTTEALTQAERELLYTLRDFANFRRGFVVSIVSDYYSVLQARDEVNNNWVAYQGFVKNVEREVALGEENRRTQTEIGQLRQAMLNAESQWVNALSDYRSQLDALKIRLGLSVDENVVLDYSELKRLGIEKPGVSRKDAVQVALATRPDLVTTEDRIDDAERGIKVAKNGLLPGLDVGVNYNPISDPGDISPSINFNRREISTTLDVDLPFDRKADRNIYRAAFVALEQAKRSHDLNLDRVRLQIYDDWRALEQAEKNFEIAELGVALALRRLEEQVILADIGQGEARDLVDAQRDLVDAQNQRTATVVTHTLARLRLWQDMGILYINGDGSWVTVLEQEGRNQEAINP